ncbi:uncharacterized protein LOC134239785 [Saccostrea cucullata]|uniref:uncharacterized protein LOC134239785 n=1 Tax=Saccostrea cuccullata TaxID=36930 RepID=UPI002ED5EAB7
MGKKTVERDCDVINGYAPKRTYWCNAFMDLGFHSPVTTTNGVESLNKALKHFYLKLANPGTLSTLMGVVIQDFLPDLFQNYVMLNYRASSNFKAYDASIPKYLHNRPRKVVEHCMQRYHSSDQIGSGDIKIADDISGRIYHVKSRESSQTYQVTMGSGKKFPHCTCEDFRRNFLLCKHFFAIFKSTNQSWSDLSPLYAESPFVNLDFGAVEKHEIVNVSSDFEIPTQKFFEKEGKSLRSSRGFRRPSRRLHKTPKRCCG